MLKFVKYILYILLAVSALFMIAFFFNQEAVLDSFLMYAYVLLGIAIVAVIGLPLINLFDNPKGLKKILFSLVAVVVLVGVSYLLASGAPLSNANLHPTENVLKLTDTGLIVTYILIAISFLSILLGGVFSIVRNSSINKN
jgi:hypothetical protein